MAVSKLALMLTNNWLSSLSAHLGLLYNAAWVGNKLPPLTLSRRQRVKLNAEEVCRVVQLLPFALTWPGHDRIGDWLERPMFTSAADSEMMDRCGSSAMTSSLTNKKVRFYSKGIFPELGTITAREVWECRLPAAMVRPPCGLHLDHGLVQVQGMVALAPDSLLVQVRWYKHTGTLQPTTSTSSRGEHEV